MGDPRQEAVDRRTQAARQRAACEKVEKLQHALEELQKVQAAPEGRAEPSQRREGDFAMTRRSTGDFDRRAKLDREERLQGT